MLERGVLRDLLGVGAVIQDQPSIPTQFAVTRLGVEQINSRFPGHGI